MAHYHDNTDFAQMSTARQEAPAEFAGWEAMHHSVFDREDGALTRRTRELMAVAVALSTKCAYCIDTHTAAAKRLGATRQELAEVMFVAGAVDAGGALAHGLLALRLFGENEAADAAAQNATQQVAR